MTSAKNLNDIAVDTSQKDITIVQLKADGTLGDYNSFNLSKPTRLVIDLWKIKRKFSKKTVSVNSPYLKQVRLGDYPQKVRVVLDFAAAIPPSYRVDRIGNVLVVALGKKEAVAKAIPQVPEIEVAAKEGKVSPPVLAKPGEIIGIDFKQLENVSRIIISTATKAPYQVNKGPKNTVVLVVQGMTIPTKLKRPLDTHEFLSPVVTITPANVTLGSKKGAQVVVKLRKMVAYNANQEDDKIYLDFERTEEFKGEKPKPVELVTTRQAPTEKVGEAPAATKQEELAKQEESALSTPKTKPTPTAPHPWRRRSWAESLHRQEDNPGF